MEPNQNTNAKYDLRGSTIYGFSPEAKDSNLVSGEEVKENKVVSDRTQQDGIQNLEQKTSANNANPVTNEEKTTSKSEAMVVLTAKLSADNKAELEGKKIEIEAIVAHLKKRYDVDLTILDVDEGSIRIRLGGSQEDLEKLEALFQAGELNEILGIPVEDVRVKVTETADDEEEIKTDNEQIKLNNELHLVREIVTYGGQDRDLRGANLSGADLRGANLIGADLSYADLEGANLSGVNLIGDNLNGANLRDANLRDASLNGAKLIDADLSGADLGGANLRYADLRGVDLGGNNLRYGNLRGADLGGANLRGTDLTGANLSGADLRGANLIGADINNAKFGYNLGISESMKQDLIERGAIFEDSPPGDRSGVLSRV